MPTITLKGRMEPLEVNYKSAKGVYDIWVDADKSGSTKIILGDIAILKSEIRQINLKDLPNLELNNKVQLDAQRDYLKERQIKLEMSPLERGKNISIFNLMWASMTNHVALPQGIANKAIAIQQEFFTKNPNRTICDPVLFRDLFVEHGLKGKISPFFDGGIRLIERCVGQDMYYARVGGGKVEITDKEMVVDEEIPF